MLRGAWSVSRPELWKKIEIEQSVAFLILWFSFISILSEWECCVSRLSDYCWTRRIVVWQCIYAVCRTAARRWVNGDRRCLRVWHDGVVRDSQEINSIILMKMLCVCLFVVVAITTSLLYEHRTLYDNWTSSERCTILFPFFLLLYRLEDMMHVDTMWRWQKKREKRNQTISLISQWEKSSAAIMNKFPARLLRYIFILFSPGYTSQKANILNMLLCCAR